MKKEYFTSKCYNICSEINLNKRKNYDPRYYKRTVKFKSSKNLRLEKKYVSLYYFSDISNINATLL